MVFLRDEVGQRSFRFLAFEKPAGWAQEGCLQLRNFLPRKIGWRRRQVDREYGMHDDGN
jgi:hypothetical protein